MKTTLDIPDELYRRAKVQAAHEKRKVKDLVAEGIRLVLGLSAPKPARPRRMTKAPVTIRRGNALPVLTNDAMALLLGRSGEKLP